MRLPPRPVALFSLAGAALTLVVSLVASGCNVFDPLSSPDGDAQILSAARACFDQGDIPCALDYYSKLSDAEADVRASERAFAILDQNGVGMAAFMVSFGTGNEINGGQGITKLGNSIGPRAGKATRAEIFRAFQYTASISSRELRGLVRFTTSAALIAELLAEGAANSSDLLATDLVVDPTACLSAALNPLACATPIDPAYVSCSSPSTRLIDTGPVNPIDLAAASTTAATITSGQLGKSTLSLIHSAVAQLTVAIDEVGASGSLGQATQGFTNGLATTALSTSPDGNCYRQALLLQDIGR